MFGEPDEAVRASWALTQPDLRSYHGERPPARQLLNPGHTSMIEISWSGSSRHGTISHTSHIGNT